MNKARIRAKISRGDYQIIAELTGFSIDYVKRVIYGSRANDKILQAAEQLIKQRKQMKRVIKQSINA